MTNKTSRLTWTAPKDDDVSDYDGFLGTIRAFTIRVFSTPSIETWEPIVVYSVYCHLPGLAKDQGSYYSSWSQAKERCETALDIWLERAGLMMIPTEKEE